MWQKASCIDDDNLLPPIDVLWKEIHALPAEMQSCYQNFENLKSCWNIVVEAGWSAS